jgi:hypothetical protein
MADAPERAFVLQLVPRFALALKQNGEADEAHAAAEAAALAAPPDKAQTLLILAEALGWTSGAWKN